MPLCHSRCQLPGEIACSRVMAITYHTAGNRGPYVNNICPQPSAIRGDVQCSPPSPPQSAAQEKEQPLHDVTSPQFPADLGSHTPELNRLTASCLFGFSLAVWLLAAPSFSVCRSWASGSRGLPSGPNPIEDVDALATDSRILLSGMAGTQNWPNMEVHMPPSGGYLHGSGHGRS